MVDGARAEAERQAAAHAHTRQVLKALKAQVRDLAGMASGVAVTRESVEALLREVDLRGQEDASWSFRFNSALEGLDQRLLGVEGAVRRELASRDRRQTAVEALAIDATAKALTKVEEEVKGMQQRLTNAVGQM